MMYLSPLPTRHQQCVIIFCCLLQELMHVLEAHSQYVKAIVRVRWQMWTCGGDKAVNVYVGDGIFERLEDEVDEERRRAEELARKLKEAEQQKAELKAQAEEKSEQTRAELDRLRADGEEAANQAHNEHNRLKYGMLLS